MTGVIFKVNYNNAGETNLMGRITTCCFFVSNNIIVACHHTFNKNIFVIDKGYNWSHYFVLINDMVIDLMDVRLFEYPDIDTTFIMFKNKSFDIIPSVLSDSEMLPGTLVHNEGFYIHQPPALNIVWEKGKLVIHKYSLDNIRKEYKGYTKEYQIMNFEIPNPQGIQLKNAKCLFLSYGGTPAGTIGAPLITKKTNEIAGMISGGIRLNATEVSEFSAISSMEIIKAMKKIGLVKKPWWKF